ncbi:sensor histidine kinase [Thalassotalea sp. ND16A]|uniref:sensor histidine kinase n=1 Tax=Thalassotalea sp. ND16A TaxID=1535422 RepID=UPI00051A01AE|nr:HAMP domain-containing sensor histidine kinase [Thalassotalea sp. ND16A]KGJ98447.1 hypothetical protein ND16A_0756 [Thalassotalea sp. ND16A]
MSLKTYLFSLIGGLILLLASSQLILVNWMSANFNEQVNLQARHMSEQVIEFAADNIEFSLEDGESVEIIELDKNGHERVKHELNGQELNEQQFTEHERIIEYENQDIRVIHQVSSNDEKLKVYKITGEPTDDVAAKKQRVNKQEYRTLHKATVVKELKDLVNEIHQIEIDGDASKPKTRTNNNQHVRKDFVYRIDTSKTDISVLMTKILWIIIVSTLIALIFAYWLSHKFNKPLKALSSGFKQLASGNYKHQVNEQGVNEIRQTICHFNEMTERLEQLAITEQKNQQLQQLAELGDVSQGLAHALRNPIHTIGLAVEQIKDPQLNEQLREQLIDTITAKINHINKTISALLQLTSSGLTRNEQVPVAAVIQDIILEYKSSDDKQLHIHSNCDNLVQVTGNESEIRSILHTLIINACEASQHNGVITISTVIDDNSQVTVRIEDDGKGLNEDIEDDLFKPHITDKPEGAGMGLYIANRLISLNYNGKLELINIDNGCQATAIFAKDKQ